MTTRMLFVVAIGVLGRTAAAQDSLTFAHADRETAAALTKIVRTASARGLPVDPIVAKIQLALVMHAAPARVVETAQAVADRLDAARGAIAPDSLPADIAAGGDALSFKVPKGVLTRIHQAAGGRAIAVPLGVLTQLVASNVPADRAGDIVTKLMRQGATTEQLLALGNDVNSDVQRGARPIESVETRFHGLTPLLSPSGNSSVNADAPISVSGPKKP